MQKKAKILFISALPLIFTSAIFLSSCKVPESAAKKELKAKIEELEKLQLQYNGEKLKSIEAEIKRAKSILNNKEAKDEDFSILTEQIANFIKNLYQSKPNEPKAPDKNEDQKENPKPQDPDTKDNDDKKDKPPSAYWA